MSANRTFFVLFYPSKDAFRMKFMLTMKSVLFFLKFNIFPANWTLKLLIIYDWLFSIFHPNWVNYVFISFAITTAMMAAPYHSENSSFTLAIFTFYFLLLNIFVKYFGFWFVWRIVRIVLLIFLPLFYSFFVFSAGFIANGLYDLEVWSLSFAIFTLIGAFFLHFLCKGVHNRA